MGGYDDEDFIALFAAGFFFSWQRFAADDSSAIKNLPQTLRLQEGCLPSISTSPPCKMCLRRVHICDNIQFGNDIFRFLGFFDGGTLLILTNGFAKKTQKTPPQEIALAIRRKEEVLARRRKS